MVHFLILSESGILMHIAICDDIYLEVKVIEDYLLSQGDTVNFYENGETLIRAYKEQGLRYDVLFLDLEMNGEKKGFKVANDIYAIDDTVLILFVTSHHQYVFESFKCNPVWFLRKPIDSSDLEAAYSHTKKLLAERQRTFTFMDSHQTVRLSCDDILYFEAQNHNILIHLKNGETYSIRFTMKELEQQLNDSFCRIHVSYIVNLRYVTRFARESDDSRQDVVKLKGLNQSLPVSRRYKKVLGAAFLRFKEKEFMV